MSKPTQDNRLLQMTRDTTRLPAQIEILEYIAEGLSAIAPPPPPPPQFIIRVTAADNNSGISFVQIGDDDQFNTFSEFSTTGGVTDIFWSVESSGEIYVRVADRAGNLSAVASEEVTVGEKVYLPIIVKNR